MFPRPRKSSNSKRGGPHDARPMCSTLASIESPEILCNPFCFPSPVPAHQNDSDDPCLDVAKHLICELPNIYLIPPNGNPSKTGICIWNSEFDGILSSFLDSDPSTPVATPRLEWPTLDWIALASAYKKIEDGQKDLPTFCRPLASDIQSRSVIMPRASTTDGVSNTWFIGPQHSCSPKTDEGHCETQGRSVGTVSPASPPTRLSGIRAGVGIGWPSGFMERSSNGADPHLDSPIRDMIKVGILPTWEKVPSVALRTFSSQSNSPLTVPISLTLTDVAASAQTHVRVNSSDRQGLEPGLSGVTACLNTNKALPSIPFQLPPLPFAVDPVVFGPLGWIPDSNSLGFMSDTLLDTGGTKSRFQHDIVTDNAFQPSLIPDDDSDSDATTASSSTRASAFPSEEDEDTPLWSELLTSLEEVALTVQSLDPPKSSPSMRLLPPASPSLPPLEFDPYGFAGDFKTYLHLHLKTSRD